MANYFSAVFTVDDPYIDITGGTANLVIGDTIQFTSFSGPTNISKEIIYYIINIDNNNYALSDSSTGSVGDITPDADGTGILVLADVTDETTLDPTPNDTLEDAPHKPLSPSVGDAETALLNHRIRFDWDPPNESSGPDDNDGLLPGQTHAVKYRVEVQRNDGTTADPSWTTVETKITANTYYVYHADTTLSGADLLKEYRALIYSLDVTGTPSTSAYNTNAKGLGAGDSGAATVAPNNPTQPVGTSRINGILVKWQDGNTGGEPASNQEPIKYRVHMGTVTTFSPGTANRVGLVTGESFLVTTRPNGTTALSVADASTNYYFKIVAVNAAGSGTSSVSDACKIKTSLSTDNDLNTISASTFKAGTSGDRITIADPADGNAVMKFYGGSSGTTIFTVGSTGYVTISGQYLNAGSVGALRVNGTAVHGDNSITETMMASNSVGTTTIIDGGVPLGKLKTGFTNGYVLTYSTASAQWTAAAPTATATSVPLSAITDSPSNSLFKYAMYNSSNSVWEAAPVQAVYGSGPAYERGGYFFINTNSAAGSPGGWYWHTGSSTLGPWRKVAGGTGVTSYNG